MRYLIHGVLAGLLISGGALAQNGPPAASGKDRPASDNTQQAQGGNSGATSSSSGQQAQTPAPPAKDDSLSNFDVNGSNAQDAMGGAPR